MKSARFRGFPNLVFCHFYPQILIIAFGLIHQALEMKQAEWSALFEAYPFFESYKNYLQIDIMAMDENDLRTWKGWVESRLRQLTLKVSLLRKLKEECGL
jgi:poly(A) polymerase Pap1